MQNDVAPHLSLSLSLVLQSRKMQKRKNDRNLDNAWDDSPLKISVDLTTLIVESKKCKVTSDKTIRVAILPMLLPYKWRYQ